MPDAATRAEGCSNFLGMHLPTLRGLRHLALHGLDESEKKFLQETCTVAASLRTWSACTWCERLPFQRILLLCEVTSCMTISHEVWCVLHYIPVCTNHAQVHCNLRSVPTEMCELAQLQLTQPGTEPTTHNCLQRRLCTRWSDACGRQCRGCWTKLCSLVA
jgi:hypothetical protein